VVRKEYLEKLGYDCGIDLVFKHKNGQTGAVQAKVVMIIVIHMMI